MAGIIKKQQGMIKKYFEDKFKELNLNGIEDRVTEIDNMLKTMKDRFENLEASAKSSLENVALMKKHFDLITIHKKYFEGLVEKPIKHADKIKAHLLDFITVALSKNDNDHKYKLRKLVEMESESKQLKNEAHMKLMRVDDALSEFRNLNQENRMLRANLEAFLTSDTDLK